MRIPPPQRGSILVMVVLALTLLAATVLARTGRDVEARRLAQAQRQQSALERARDQVLAWVAPHLGDFDAAQAIDAATLLAQSGVDLRAGVRLAVGPLRTDSGERFRSLALWLPAAVGDAPALASDGGFASTADPARFLTFSTRALEQDARRRSIAILERLAREAEARFATKAALDPDHRMEVNWFRAPDGVCRTGTDQVPCATDLAPDSWPALELLRTQSLVGQDPRGGGSELDRNGWGGLNFWSNDADPAYFAHPPYSMAFSTVTPWGERISVMAVQPL